LRTRHPTTVMSQTRLTLSNLGNLKLWKLLSIIVLAESLYIDWNNSFEVLDKAYEAGLFVLIIGPKGTGKTTLVREFATRKGKN